MTRPAQTFDWKLAQLKKLGFDAMMFHDDDAVPDIDTKTEAQIRKEATELKKKLDDAVQAALKSEAIIYSVGIGDNFYSGVDKGALNKISERTGGRAYFQIGRAHV